MRDFSIVFAYELRQQLSKKTVRVTTLLLVAVMLAVTSIPRFMSMFGGDGGGEPVADTTMTQEVGYVFSSAAQQERFTALLALSSTNLYPSRDALVQAVEDGALHAGFAVAADLSYEVVFLDKDVSSQQDTVFRELITRLEKERMLSAYGLSPEDYARIDSFTPNERVTLLGKEAENNMLVAMVLMVCVYMLVLLYGQSISMLIAREKDSKAMELLITSTKPTPLILGKVAAGGVSGILQFGLIILGAFAGVMINKGFYPPELLMMLSGAMSTGYILSFVFFSVTGYLLYLFLYAALGSTVSRVEDLGSAVGGISFLFIAAYMAATFAVQMPSSGVAVVTSLIPFTSIMVMPVRAGVMSVPAWEFVVSGLLMLLFIALFAWLSIKIYRWGSLNYGNKTSIVRVVKEALRHERR